MKTKEINNASHTLYVLTLFATITLLIVLLFVQSGKYHSNAGKIDKLKERIDQLQLDSIVWHRRMDNWCKVNEVTHQKLIDMDKLIKYYESDY